ncbi:MAG TPA: 2-dehydropantoate 2-reductase [Candidatus Dormibacteraeota bacterium]|nr:2-dehydropantoate 2-reductase [Candidatus Dormibacteraeota bacterium]
MADFAVVGAGAIGAYLGARLAAAGFDVTLIARGAHLEAMRARGLRVIEADGSTLAVAPACTDDLAAAGTAETIFVTVKAHGLPAIAPALGALLHERTTLVFAQNGVPWWFFSGRRRLETVDPGGVIAASIPLRHVMGCVVYPATSLVEPGVVRHLEGNRLSLGEPDGVRSDRARAIAAALTRAGFKAPVQTRLRQEIWLKLIGNAALNPVSALTRATLGELLADPGTRELVRTLMLEVEAVGRATGIEPDLPVDRRLDGAARVGEHRTSMLQDVEAGRPLEVEALVGAVVELAGQLRVPVPALDVVYRLTRRLDASVARERPLEVPRRAG